MRLSYPTDIKIVKVPCSGRVAISHIMRALEMGADAEDLGLTIHPHPTLSETVCFAAEMAEGTITDLMPPRKRT